MMLMHQICLLFAFLGSAYALEDLARPPATVEAFDGGFNLTMSTGDYKSQTSYKFNGCNPEQQRSLTAATVDAVFIAWQGLDVLNVPGGAARYWIDFNTPTAIDFFGPNRKDNDLQTKILSKSPHYRGLI